MDVKDINLNEYEVDECLDNGNIVLRKKKSKFPTWEGLGNISGVFIGAKSALAMAQISQLIPYYGGEITNDEWKDSSIRKYIIFRKMSYVGRCEAYSNYEFLAFHTAEQRDEFLKNNEQLVKDYLMIE